MTRLRILLSFILLVSIAPQAAAAPAGVPGQMTYQGVLLDDQGAAQTGPVNLTVRIWDEATNGTLLYKQEFPSTALSAGTFTLVIGPTGAPSDVPTDPLTTNLPDVFSGDLVSGPNRFFELTAGGDPALGRIQILSSPLAMRAESAATADTAQSVVNINGFSPLFFSEMLEHFNFDGQEPPASDPREGVADPDGDGIANFVDPDNDGDGLQDNTELANGTDINLVTPTLSGVTPGFAGAGDTPTLTLSGLHFEPGMSVSVGTLTPAPTNVTATSAEVSPSNPPGPGLVDVTVTRTNGESSTLVDGFQWLEATLIVHNVTSANTLTFGIRNDNDPILGRFTHQYYVDRTGNGVPETFIHTTGHVGTSAHTFDSSGTVVGVRCTGTTASCTVSARIDDSGDDVASVETPIETLTPSGGGLQAVAVAASGGGVAYAYAARRDTGSTDQSVAVATDYNDDGDFSDANEIAVLDTGLDSAQVRADITSGGSPVVLFERNAGSAKSVWLAVDLSGDGDFDDTVGGTPEIQMITAADTWSFDVAVDGSDRVGVVYRSGNDVTVLHDRNGDGDFADVGETQTFPDGPLGHCRIEAKGSGIAVVVEALLGGAAATDLRLRRDLNDDGDFDDPLETTDLLDFANGDLDMATSPAGGVFFANDVYIFGPY